MKNKINKNIRKVFVALSGGVDSGVSAKLLMEKEFDVCGVFIKVWQPPWMPCTQDDDRISALRVAAHLGIPFSTVDLSKEYKKEIVDYMVEEYAKGNTPNPDVLCNRKIKFGALWDFVKKNGGDFIATGHYAMREKIGGDFVLLRGKDKTKDQSYFLWQLTQNDLSHSLFPIGHLQKKQVRALAQKYELPNAKRPDSQGLCFMGSVDMRDFLSRFISHEEGKVIDEFGNEIGKHSGAQFYTLGQRHGFLINENKNNRNPFFVLGKDIQNNTITVGNEREEKIISVNLKNINFIDGKIKNGNYLAELRYHSKPIRAQLNEDVLTMEAIAPAKGQSVVLYKGGECIGGGVVG